MKQVKDQLPGAASVSPAAVETVVIGTLMT